MSKPKHTPTPWTYCREYRCIGTENGMITKMVSSLGEAGIGKNIIASEQEANGPFIVLACNSYYPMLEALKEFEEDIRLYLEWAKHKGRTNSELERIGGNVKLAIAQALEP